MDVVQMKTVGDHIKGYTTSLRSSGLTDKDKQQIKKDQEVLKQNINDNNQLETILEADTSRRADIVQAKNDIPVLNKVYNVTDLLLTAFLDADDLKSLRMKVIQETDKTKKNELRKELQQKSENLMADYRQLKKDMMGIAGGSA